MRAAYLICAVALLAACGDDEPAPSDAGVTVDSGATSADAGTGPTTQCGSALCGETEFCLTVPTGPCESRDGGPCGAVEEACEAEGVVGCTTPQTRTCEAIPTSCPTPASCACFIAENPCTKPNPDCLRAQGMGIRIECPF